MTRQDAPPLSAATVGAGEREGRTAWLATLPTAVARAIRAWSLRHPGGTVQGEELPDQAVLTLGDIAFQAGHAGSIPVTRSTY